MQKVSVIITSYNIEKYIEKCIDSVINQTYSNLEIIIVDDGSEDKTVDMIKKYLLIDSRIILINKENTGVQDSRITGLNKCNGEYVLFIDGDDWLEYNAIEKLYRKAKDSNSDIVYYTYNIYYSEDKYWKCEMPKIEYNNEYEFLEKLLITELQPGLCLKFIKKKFIEENNIIIPINTGFGEDLATSVLLAVNKPIVSYLEEPLYYYFQRNTSVTKDITNRVFDICITIDLIKEYLINSNLYNLYKEEYEFLIYSHIYISRVISPTYKSKFHKEFAVIWKRYGINIKKNRVYKTYIKKQKLKSRIKLNCYNKNYKIGLLYSIITEKIKLMVGSQTNNQKI